MAYIYSSLCSYTKPVVDKTWGYRGSNVTKITIHHWGNVTNAKNGADYMYSRTDDASCNYIVGNDAKIAGSVPENYAPWTSANKANDLVAITIETSNSQASGNYPVSDGTYSALVTLCADICNRYNITPHYDGTANGTITYHKMFSSTACPGAYLIGKIQSGEFENAIKAKMQSTGGNTISGSAGSAASSNYQVMLYPVKTMLISRIWGASDHPAYQFDETAGSGSVVPVYAPCDCELVNYYNSYDLGNTVFFRSTNSVITPSGVKKVWFSFTHTNSHLSGTAIGKTYKQGEICYYTGMSGMATGNHVHIDQTFTEASYFVNKNGVGGYAESVSPDKVYYVNEVSIKQNGGLAWQTYSGTITTTKTLKWFVKETDASGGAYQWQGTEMNNNILCMYSYFMKKGWTENAVIGLIANVIRESYINPAQWGIGELDNQNTGFGLIMWTPATKIIPSMQSAGIWKTDYQAYGDFECDFIHDGTVNMTQWVPAGYGKYMTGNDYINSTESAEQCVIDWYDHAERGLNHDADIVKSSSYISWIKSTVSSVNWNEYGYGSYIPATADHDNGYKWVIYD
jgi:hypothetical protein